MSSKGKKSRQPSDTQFSELKTFVVDSLKTFEAKWQVGNEVTSASEPDGFLNELRQLEARLLERISACERNAEAAAEKFDERLDAMEAYSRRNCILIHGVPESKNENVEAQAIAIINKQVLTPGVVRVSRGDIDRVHRLGRPNSTAADGVRKGARPIIVKFSSYRIRHLVFSKKRMLKKTGITITESLTLKRMQWLRQVRALLGVKSCWTTDGVIRYRPKRESD